MPECCGFGSRICVVLLVINDIPSHGVWGLLDAKLSPVVVAIHPTCPLLLLRKTFKTRNVGQYVSRIYFYLRYYCTKSATIGGGSRDTICGNGYPRFDSWPTHTCTTTYHCLYTGIGMRDALGPAFFYRQCDHHERELCE